MDEKRPTSNRLLAYELLRRHGTEPVVAKPYLCPYCGVVKIYKTDHIDEVFDYCPCKQQHVMFRFDPHLAVVVLANGGKLP